MPELQAAAALRTEVLQPGEPLPLLLLLLLRRRRKLACCPHLLCRHACLQKP